MKTKTTSNPFSSTCNALLLLSIVILSSISAKAQDVSGTDFHFIFPAQSGGTNPSYDLTIVSAGFAVTGKVLYRAGAGAAGIKTLLISIPAAGSQKVTIPAGGIDNSSGVVSNIGGVHIFTDTPVSVYSDAYAAASVDGEAIMPTDKMCGTNFTTVSYTELDPAKVTVVATQPNTTVTITPKQNGGAFLAPITVLLKDSLQSYSYQYGAGTSRVKIFLTGTKITSDKPIYATGRTTCTWIGNADYPGCGACDVMMSPLMPESQWGSKFITAQILKRNAMNPVLAGNGSMADYLEISTGAVGGTVTIQHLGGPSSRVLAAYDRWMFEAPKSGGIGEANTVITCTAPIQVYQYMKGYECDGQGNADAECVLVHPETRWNKEYRFGLPFTPSSPSYQLTVVVDGANAAALSSFQQNGSAPLNTPTWISIPGSTYKYAYFTLLANPAVQTLTASVNFSFYVFTAGAAESFVTQGGAPFLYIVTPLNLIGFDVKMLGGNKIETKWITASEQNTSHFILERAKNGINFEPIGQVKAAGNSNDKREYSFIDNSPLYGLNYYRLKEVDINGRVNLSPVKLIELRKDKVFELISLQPNPANDKTTLVYTTGSKGTIQYRIIDIVGKEVQKGLVNNVNEGNNELSIDIAGLTKGIYYIIAQKDDTDQLVKVKFIKE